ncbi:hypothetical protein HZC20_00585 [Candidatus Peregrinibacteria bacterium]|nr:hypothetical protein [Candidatus Peregrinibacteria bacterium]
MSETIFKPVKIRGATILITATTILSNLIGLARDKVIALHFGTSATTDIYNASFLIPDTLFNLFIAGALAAAFMPVFSKYLQEDQKEAMKIANIMATVTSLAILVLSILAFIFMKNIIAISFPNVSVDTQKSIVDMTKLMLPSAIIFAISGILGNILMSYKHFTSYSISPLLYNLGIILGILFLNKSTGIYSAAIGVLIGAILHCLVRILDVIKTPYSYKTTFEIFHPGFKKIIKLMIPRSLTLVVWQINLYIFAVVRMSMITGGLAAFYFARNIQSLHHPFRDWRHNPFKTNSNPRPYRRTIQYEFGKLNIASTLFLRHLNPF